ncbi:hypothetical protein ADUPG1_014181 [Aduncisulcus paluster]|uniref:Uncharacterized protein n=1 Tax=Aduncisulcus paluster TaxID=2918883 RepID=A0ABQ5KB28_9EUKA|nr:hypothetical protein ADUPG1_014181 [Aduncisulcus paluster]
MDRISVTSLFERSFLRIKEIFDEFSGSSESILSHRDLFTLCFECLSLFIRHRVDASEESMFLACDEKKREIEKKEKEEEEKEEKGFENDGTKDDEIMIIRSICPISLFVHSLFEPILRVESVLGEWEEEEEEDQRVGKRRILNSPPRPISKTTPCSSTTLTNTDDVIDDTNAVSATKLIMKVKASGKRRKEVSPITSALFRIINGYVLSISTPRYDIIATKILPLLSKVFFLGESETEMFENSLVEDIIEICQKILCWQTNVQKGFEKENLLRDALFTIILPHILPWMKKYPGNNKKFMFVWVDILNRITVEYRVHYHRQRDSMDVYPLEEYCSQIWFMFHPVMELIKDIIFIGSAKEGKELAESHVVMKREKLNLSHCVSLLFNLSCIPAQAIEIHTCLMADRLLERIFEVFRSKIHKEKEANDCLDNWCKLVSMLSMVPSLVPQLSPKFDDAMEWCKQNGRCYRKHFAQYVGNCVCHLPDPQKDLKSLKKWFDVLGEIQQCEDNSTLSKLYQEHKPAILTIFLACQSKSEIDEHKLEIILCIQCLINFLKVYIEDGYIYLPSADINDFYDTFLDHFSRFEKELDDGLIDEEYCLICSEFSSEIFHFGTFLEKVSPSVARILARGCRYRFGGDIAPKLLKSLYWANHRPRNDKTLILSLVKTYFKDWLRLYCDDRSCFNSMTGLLSELPCSENDQMRELWHLLMHPFIYAVKKQFDGGLVLVESEHLLWVFATMSFDNEHAIEVFDNIEGLLEGFFGEIQRDDLHWGIQLWVILIQNFSTFPSLIPRLSPKFDDSVDYCRFQDDLSNIPKYYDNVSKYISTTFPNVVSSMISFYYPSFIRSMPMVSMIPSIETTLSPDSDGFLYYASHIYSGMEIVRTFKKQSEDLYYNIITGEAFKCYKCIQRGSLCCSLEEEEEGKVKGKDYSSSSEPNHRKGLIPPSSLIQYTSPPQHMLVKMPFDDERSLRQSVYDLIERTGGGVEVMFE